MLSHSIEIPCRNPHTVKMSSSFSTADSLSGLFLLTSPTPDHPSALNSSNYSSTPHNPLPQNEVDETQGTSMFSMSHRTAPGSSGHFWFLQVGFKYLEDNDSKITMLLGLSLLMEILPDAIDGFALHPLEPDSTLLALTNNKTEDRFPGSALLAFKCQARSVRPLLRRYCGPRYSTKVLL